MKYISQAGLAHLDQYKYHGIDNSLIAKYIMQPFWRNTVNLLPIWMAPNLVTLLGFFAIVASYLIMAFYCPGIEETAPSWVYLFAAVCIFWYQTMDALDGKQARRTGTSSPLGELFDHGCDAMSTTLIGLTYACSMRLGSGWFFFAVTLSSYCVFFMAQWEEFQTGIMELGYMSVTEIQLMIMGFYLYCFACGTDLWTENIQILGYETTVNMIPAAIIFIGAVATMIGNVIKVLNTKNVNIAKAFGQLIPLSILVIGATTWAALSPSNVAETMPHLFFLTVGFIFSFITGRIVTNRVCGEDFSLFQPIELGLVVAVLYCLFDGPSYFPERYLLNGYLCLAILQYLHFANGVIGQMTTHLKIRCFHIPVKKQQ